MEEIKKIEVQGQQYGVADMLMRELIKGLTGGHAQVIEWSHTHNMNDYKDAGTYRIKGERTGNPMSDNLPIMNQGSGHTIDGILYVFDSSLTTGSGKEDDCTVTQFLILSNRVGGQEGDMYMRSAYGSNKDSLIWKPWEKYQTNMEVGFVTNANTLNPDTGEVLFGKGMNNLTDNGIYSGVYLPPKSIQGTNTVVDQEAIETFVMIVINNYQVAGDARCVTQIKFAVTNGGVFSMEKRSSEPGTTDIWLEWESVGGGTVDQQLDGYSKNAVSNAAVYQQFYKQQEELKKCATKENLVQGLDWENNTNKEFHIKNRTHHMKDYLCKYFTGSPIAISKPSDTGYVVIAYDTDGDAKYLKVEIKANEYKTQEFVDAMGLPIIFTWDPGASTINVQSFSGALDKISMRAYYSSSAKSFDDYFVKLDEGFLPSIGGGGSGSSNSLINEPNTSNSSSLVLDADTLNLKFSTFAGDWDMCAKKHSISFHNNVTGLECIIGVDGLTFGTDTTGSDNTVIGNRAKIGNGVKIDDDIHITKDSLNGIFYKWTPDSNMNSFKSPGTYNIYGERTRQDDNLPILNASSGHSIAARLTVVASTLQPANNEICITQFLQLSNRIGGEGATYVRTYNENNNGMNGWSSWQKQTGMVETLISSNDVTVSENIFSTYSDKIGDGLNGMLDNGMYSGIYIDNISYTGTSSIYYLSAQPTFVETFVLVVINDYAAAGKLGVTRHITQLKYAVDAITGQSTVKKRVGTGNDSISWGDWENVGSETGPLNNYLGVKSFTGLRDDRTIKSGTYYGLLKDYDNRPFVLEVVNNYDDEPNMLETDKRGFKVLRCASNSKETTLGEWYSNGYYSDLSSKFQYNSFARISATVVKKEFVSLYPRYSHCTMIFSDIDKIDSIEVPSKGSKIYNAIITKSKALNVTGLTINVTPSHTWSLGGGLSGCSMIDAIYEKKGEIVCYDRFIYDENYNRGYLAQTITEFEELQ